MVLIVPGPPVGRQRERVVVRGGRAYRYPRPQCGAYLARVRACWRQSGGVRAEGPVALAIQAAFPIPPSTRPGPRARMRAGRQPPQRFPDAGDIAALVVQALSGLAFRDGRQVAALTVEKIYAPGDPQVRLEITPWTPGEQRRGGERPWQSAAGRSWRR